MIPYLREINEKRLAGKHMQMSYAENKTTALWNNFMLDKKYLRNTIGTDLYSIQIYPPGFFENFNPGMAFEKWAAAEVSDAESIPDGFQSFVIPAGLYAVFLYRGSSTDASQVFQYIFGSWLPGSIYTIDDRPHFEVLGEKYKNQDPNSEEEIWIPVKPMNTLHST